MPWSCPKCGFIVGHGTIEQPLPKNAAMYACPVCHAEMAFDVNMQRLITTPSRSSLGKKENGSSKH